MDLDVEALKAKLAALRTEHRDLDDVIARVVERGPFDQLQLQRASVAPGQASLTHARIPISAAV